MHGYRENVRVVLMALMFGVAVAIALTWAFGNEDALLRGDFALGLMGMAIVLFVLFLTPACDKVLEWICRR